MSPCSTDIRIMNLKIVKIFDFSVILDASDECQSANFNLDPTTTTSRQWDIKVTQYACGDEDKAGPDGCLQYFTGTTGVVAK